MKFPRPDKPTKNKRTKHWARGREKLKIEYARRGLISCEVRLPGCLIFFALSFAHRHKRVWYYDKPDLLANFNETVLACAKCHAKMESDKELTEKVFQRLRKNEIKTENTS
jgi:hypothetical protein